MRDIRKRIAQVQGIDLSTQQIQDLAARRLESILDPRAIKPSLLNALRRSSRNAPTRHVSHPPSEPSFTFEDSTIYDSHRGMLRFIRRLLNPLLKLLFNPNPVIDALHRQAKLNAQRAERDAERDREQTEWNALHYEIVQRLVTEVSRVSLESKSMTMRIESLDAKLEFNEKRVRGIEGSTHRERPRSRSVESVTMSAVPAREASPVDAPSNTATPRLEDQAADPVKRRRRRRRGRRAAVPNGDAAQGVGTTQIDQSEKQTSDVPEEPSSNRGETSALGQPPSQSQDAAAPTPEHPVIQPPTVVPPAREGQTPDAQPVVAVDPQQPVEAHDQSADVTPEHPIIQPPTVVPPAREGQTPDTQPVVAVDPQQPVEAPDQSADVTPPVIVDKPDTGTGEH